LTGKRKRKQDGAAVGWLLVVFAAFFCLAENATTNHRKAL
jgi:hypothetical protein